jgi:hypothetical protein
VTTSMATRWSADAAATWSTRCGRGTLSPVASSSVPDVAARARSHDAGATRGQGVATDLVDGRVDPSWRRSRHAGPHEAAVHRARSVERHRLRPRAPIARRSEHRRLASASSSARDGV